MDAATLAELDEQQRAVAARHWQVRRPVGQDGVRLAVADQSIDRSSLAFLSLGSEVLSEHPARSRC